MIGGGASGLMAAGQAAQAGAETVILEKMKLPGRKLAITGKGRCNLTNIATVPEFIEHFGRNGRFLRQAFTHFFSSDTVTFFKKLGVKTVTERGGRVFPESENADDVVGALLKWNKKNGVVIKNRSTVKRLLVKNGFITGVKTVEGQVHKADSVIIATGGVSYPGTGSTGDGYRLAESAGHSIIPVRPALVPLETAGDIAGRLQGLSLRNVAVRLRENGKKRAQVFGEMLFTHFGISGPIILSLSKIVVDALHLNHGIEVSIDLKPALDEQKLDARLLRDFSAHGKKKFSTLLKNLLPRKLIDVCIDLTGIPPDKAGHQISSRERKRLRIWLKDFRLKITGHRPIAEAIITAGGVNTREVNPGTMESRIVQGLYIAGEVLDIDADTGGYNLQAAFSTGWLAGISAAE